MSNGMRVDNYLKVSVYTNAILTDYVLPFASRSQEERIDALATAAGLSLRHVELGARVVVSAWDPRPFLRDGETLPKIGDWHPDDLRDPGEPEGHGETLH